MGQLQEKEANEATQLQARVVQGLVGWKSGLPLLVQIPTHLKLPSRCAIFSLGPGWGEVWILGLPSLYKSCVPVFQTTGVFPPPFLPPLPLFLSGSLLLPSSTASTFAFGEIRSAEPGLSSVWGNVTIQQHSRHKLCVLQLQQTIRRRSKLLFLLLTLSFLELERREKNIIFKKSYMKASVPTTDPLISWIGNKQIMFIFNNNKSISKLIYSYYSNWPFLTPLTTSWNFTTIYIQPLISTTDHFLMK